MHDSNKRTSWAGLDPDFLCASDSENDSQSESSSTKEIKRRSNATTVVTNDDGKAGGAADRRCSWGDLDSMIGQFNALPTASTMETHLDAINESSQQSQSSLNASITEDGSSRSNGMRRKASSRRKNGMSKSATSTSSVQSRHEELRSRIRKSRSASMGLGSKE